MIPPESECAAVPSRNKLLGGYRSSAMVGSCERSSYLEGIILSQTRLEPRELRKLSPPPHSIRDGYYGYGQGTESRYKKGKFPMLCAGLTHSGQARAAQYVRML
jgi:hypothetical protein